MWDGRNPRIPYIVFMDRELKLQTSPDVFADHRFLPFRDDSFSCIIYDPPFMARFNPPQYWNDPTRTPFKDKRGFQGTNEWWGLPKNTSELWGTIHRAQKEFMRISERVCLKWAEVDYTMWKVMPFFKDWIEIYRQGFKQTRHAKGYMWKMRASPDTDCKTWWTTFIRKRESKTVE